MQLDSITLHSLLRPRRRAFPFSLFTMIVALSAAFGCGGGGCSCMSPIPGGFPAEERTPNAAQIRVSSTGIAAITDDPGALVAGLTGGPLSFDVPPSCGGTPSICCNGTTPVTPCGPLVIDLDEQPGDAPRMVITPVQGTSSLDVIIRARVHTETPLVIGIIGATCQLAIDTDPGAEPDLRIDTTVNLVVDPASNTTRVEVGTVAISQLVAGDDLELTGEGIGNAIACAAFGFVLPLAQDALVGTFEDAIKGAIEGQLCKACPGGDVAECGEFAIACTDNVCMQTADVCLQELGATGRLAGVFAGLSPGTTGTIDLYEVAGGYATTNNGGISLGLLGGMLPAGEVRDRCGPSATPPAVVTIPESTFFRGNTRPDTEPPAPFDVAIGVHENQLDRFAYAAYEGGLLCLTIGTSTVDLLNSDTLGLFIPSLANLIDGPQSMALGLRPQSPPTIVLGRNTFVDDGSGGTELGEPLLDINFTALELDFFVSIEGQYVRLFTLVADVHLPVGLEIGEGELIPVLGDLDAAFSNLSVKNSEPLTETPEELAEVFPTLLDLALPQLAGALGGFAVPEIGGLNIQVTDITAVDNVTFLAIFGELVPAAMAAPAPRVDTTAELVELTIPGTEVFADTLRWDPARRPRVELALGGDGSGLEWSHRIDGGVWTPWSAQAHRSLSSNLFWLQGHHQVEVRARRAGRPETVDLTPVVLRPIIDTLPPTTAVELIPGGLHVNGGDLVSRRGLRMRWRIAGGAWTEAPVPSVIPLADGVAPRDVEIEMFDEVGNRSPARGPADVAMAPFHGQAGEAGCGCTSRDGDAGNGALLLGLGAIALLGRRRRRRVSPREVARVALLLGAALAFASLPACDCGGDPPCGPVECMEGEVAMGAIGRFNGVAATADRAVVSTYDETLGDLVFVEVAAGSEYAYTAIDGIPDQTPSYQPNTYRGGIPTPGPDVGAWSSVALGDGLARIAYQDRDLTDLKVAVEDDDHRWTTHVVDGDADEIVGQFASIAITSDGAPAIAYLATNIGDGSAGKTTELRLAKASGPDPSQPSDWTVTTIASAPTSCAGLCGDDRACLPATDTAPETCVATGAGCPAECADTEACIASVCTAIVVDPTTEQLPGGLGLFANLLVRPDGRLTIVHYDMNRTALIAHVETAAGSGTFTEVILDGEDGSDRGMWATAVVGADGTVHVAYQEALGDQVFYTTLGSAPGPVERVDDGVRDGDRPHIVGAGAVIFLDGTAPQIVYQDGLAADLVQATRAGNAWTYAELASGALIDGFHLAATPDGAWLVWDSLDKERTPATGLEIRELN